MIDRCDTIICYVDEKKYKSGAKTAMNYAKKQGLKIINIYDEKDNPTYCAWQKGTNENSNGLLREFYPKGRNLSRVSEKTLKKNLALINARPRKVLNYKTAAELFEKELKKCCT